MKFDIFFAWGWLLVLWSKNNHGGSLIILLTAACSDWINKSNGLTLRSTELWAYRALKSRTFSSLLFARVMDGAYLYSGSPRFVMATLSTLLFRRTVKNSRKHVNEICPPSLMPLCQELVWPSCQRWLIGLDSATVLSPQRFFSSHLRLPRAVRITVYSPWMVKLAPGCAEISSPLNPPPQVAEGITLFS